MLELEGPEFADLVEEYDAKFEELWVTGEGKLDAFRAQVDTSTSFPIVFPALSLSWAEVRDLKSLIAAEVPGHELGAVPHQPDVAPDLHRRSG